MTLFLEILLYDSDPEITAQLEQLSTQDINFRQLVDEEKIHSLAVTRSGNGFFITLKQFDKSTTTKTDILDTVRTILNFCETHCPYKTETLRLVEMMTFRSLDNKLHDFSAALGHPEFKKKMVPLAFPRDYQMKGVLLRKQNILVTHRYGMNQQDMSIQRANYESDSFYELSRVLFHVLDYLCDEVYKLPEGDRIIYNSISRQFLS